MAKSATIFGLYPALIVAVATTASMSVDLYHHNWRSAFGWLICVFIWNLILAAEIKHRRNAE